MPSELSDVSNLSNLSISSSRVDHQSADSKQPPTPASSDETASSGPVTGGGSEGGGNSSDNTNADMKKAYMIAKELLTTEIHYVSKLHLIDQVRLLSSKDSK